MAYTIFAEPYGWRDTLVFKDVKDFKITKTFLIVENKFRIRLTNIFAIFLNGKKESDQIWSDERGMSCYKKTFDSKKKMR